MRTFGLRHTLRRSASCCAPYRILAESDDVHVMATLDASGALSIRTQAPLHGQPMLPLGNRLTLLLADVAFEPQATDVRLHSKMRALVLNNELLLQPQGGAAGVRAGATIRLQIHQQPVFPMPHTELCTHKFIKLGRRDIQMQIVLAMWPADGVTTHAQTATLRATNGSDLMTLRLEPALFNAVVAGLSSGQRGIALRLQPHVASRELVGEWAPLVNERGVEHDWPTRYALSIALHLSSAADGSADGRDLKEPAWRELVERTAARAVKGLNAALEAVRAAERQRVRDQRLRNHVAEQCAVTVDRWLAETRADLRERAMEIIHADMDAARNRDNDGDDSQNPTTVRAWIEGRMLAQLQ